MNLAYRSWRLKAHRTFNVALLPTVLVEADKPDAKGFAERTATLRFWDAAISLSWGGPWAPCADCGRHVSDMMTMRFAGILPVRCSACADAREAREMAEFEEQLKTGKINIPDYMFQDEEE